MRNVLRLFRRGAQALADAVCSYTILILYFDIVPRNWRPTSFCTLVRPYGRFVPGYTCTAPYSTADTATNLVFFRAGRTRGELSYLAPLGSENISAPYFKQCFFRGGGSITPRQSNTTPPSPKTEINILFYILNFASIIKFKM